MNKQTYKGNLSSKINIAELKDKFKGMRVLYATANILRYDNISKIKDFFDVIIVDNPEVLEEISTPDIFLHLDDIPYNNSHFMDYLKDLSASLICAKHSSLKALEKLKRKFYNYFLSLEVVNNEPTANNPYDINGVSFGLSAADPALHLANIMGATEKYSTSDIEGWSYLSADDFAQFIETVNKYKIPVNKKTHKRKNIIEVMA